MKKAIPYILYVAALAIGIFIGVKFASSEDESNEAMNEVLKVLKEDVSQLKIQRESDERIATAIRSEINGLKLQRGFDSTRIALYDYQLISLKKKYDQIHYRYNNIGADSIAVLFKRAFDY
jgi:hypothetical protein